jgi:hypothetical protein
MPCRGSPDNCLVSIAAWIDLLRPSARMMKRNGERGSPYLIPLEGEKGCEGTPLTRIEKKAVEVRFTIQVTHLESKPKDSSIARIYSQLILSKALERSNLRSIPGVLVFCKEWITS